MLLALDTIGAFRGETLTGRWRLRTIREQTADEWGILLRNVFAHLLLDDDHGHRHTILAGGVPPCS